MGDYRLRLLSMSMILILLLDTPLSMLKNQLYDNLYDVFDKENWFIGKNFEPSEQVIIGGIYKYQMRITLDSKNTIEVAGWLPNYEVIQFGCPTAPTAPINDIRFIPFGSAVETDQIIIKNIASLVFDITWRVADHDNDYNTKDCIIRIKDVDQNSDTDIPISFCQTAKCGYQPLIYGLTAVMTLNAFIFDPSSVKYVYVDGYNLPTVASPASDLTGYKVLSKLKAFKVITAVNP